MTLEAITAGSAIPCNILSITETPSTFQELYGTEEENGQVPQDCDVVLTDYKSRMTSKDERHCEDLENRARNAEIQS